MSLDIRRQFKTSRDSEGGGIRIASTGTLLLVPHALVAESRHSEQETVETRDPVILRSTCTEDRCRRLPLRVLARGDQHKLWNPTSGDRHVFGVGDAS